MTRLFPYLKALTAALVAGVSVLVAASADGTVTSQDWFSAALAFLVGLSAVWAVPNRTG